MSAPDREVLSPFEGTRLQWFFETAHVHFFEYWDYYYFGIGLGQRPLVWKLTEHLGPQLSSKVVRSALLLMCLSYKRNHWAGENPIDLESSLRARFKKDTIESINCNRYAEIVHGTFCMCVYHFERGEPALFAKHFYGFLGAYEKFVTLTTDEEAISVKSLYSQLLSRMTPTYVRHFKYHIPPKLASDDISRFISRTTRTVDLGQIKAPCCWDQALRYQLLYTLLWDGTRAQRLQNVTERILMIQTIKHHLLSLSLTLQTKACQRDLERLQLLGSPPLHGAKISIKNYAFITRFCFFYLHFVLLFDKRLEMDSLGFSTIEIALTTCGLIACCSDWTEESSSHFGFYEFRALFCARLILSELCLWDCT